MESDKVKELQDAFCDIRKAHRLIFSFQQRMLELAQFIARKLDMPLQDVHHSIGKEQSLSPSYPFECEFHDIPDGKFQYTISLLPCVDTGFSDKEDSVKNVPDTFAPEEQAGSKLVFYVCRKQKKSSDWSWRQWHNRNELFDEKSYMSKDFKKEVIDYPEDNEKVLLYSFPIERFIDEQSTIEALQEFADYCNKELDLNIRLI